MLNSSKVKLIKAICTVCIATYKREILLRKLLHSILSQNLPDGISLQVIVVDNDEKESAKKVVEEFSNTEEIAFEYFVQPIKNISLTRNIAVQNSRGEYLFFIDDDEWAEKDWIKYHLVNLRYYNADASFGCVNPVFSEETPAWIRLNSVFDKKCPPTGSITASTRTSNCCVKSEWIKIENGPFDPRYGITGGEDTHLFERLRRRGAKLISSREAIVYETIPVERTKIKWMLKKSYQTGNTATRRFIEFADNKIMKRITLFIRAIFFLITSIFLFIIFIPVTKYRIFFLLKVASNTGHISALLGFHYQGYR